MCLSEIWALPILCTVWHAQVEFGEQFFWGGMLCGANNRLSMAKDPLFPWLSEALATSISDYPGMSTGSLSMEHVRPCHDCASLRQLAYVAPAWGSARSHRVFDGLLLCSAADEV